jgi:biotin carboxyl carrier protein
MKYKVIVRGKQFTVELTDLHTQPIVALVEGEPVEVWLENQYANEPVGLHAKPQQKAPSSGLSISNATEKRSKTMIAPIPGVVISIAVHEGDEVATGQVICVLEAMKMKNAIRSHRKGVIASVRVTLGQSVQHHDVLVEFAD